MNENYDLMMKHILRMSESYVRVLKELTELRHEIAELKRGMPKREMPKREKVYQMEILKSANL